MWKRWTEHVREARLGWFGHIGGATVGVYRWREVEATSEEDEVCRWEKSVDDAAD